ncbi:M61 family metallopeptidase [Flavobacterium undicola]|uniref:M61 family metallopeptidase n=1 Tax=Flavobacterium undicola TaxID=1932779 RepID=UPI001376AFAE|nr:peptidase M61 [Flavobacterium undicola]MBA0883282.1 peptidase M61 [Flavobacterium undicola]
MKKTFFVLAITSLILSCKTINAQTTKEKAIQVDINLNEVKNDQVLVTVNAPKSSSDEITFRIPKTVPGTYSEDNYGKYIDNLKAYDKKGNLLTVKKTDENSWTITKAKSLNKITYLVNDTFDSEKGTGFGKDDVFSPAGSNINAGENFMINTHCFVGYFDNSLTTPYQVSINHPANLWGSTSMTDQDSSTTKDVFVTSRYAELVENPIMYSKPDYTTFNVDGMDIQICVYSPTGKYTAESITAEMKAMMTAQKHFLGKINATKKYSVLLYLSSMKEEDARGFGALEHPTATTVVLPEMMKKDELVKSMMDVVSHEFFHIVTPLTIHSKEIQYFDYNAPKMSEHLWMYEGVTEYFANLFQINQGLITEEDFYNRIAEKIEGANKMDDTMSFTTMSTNVLKQPYKDQYINVYQKGALIGMCIDIIIREKSNGQRGILDLMQKLSNEYGVSKPFNDLELFDKIMALTYPEVGDFLKTYVAGTTPIPYDFYLAKVGLAKSKIQVAAAVFLKDQKPYITVNPNNNEISVIPNIELNVFFTNLGLKGGDVILEINNVAYNYENIYDMINQSSKWQENEAITVKIKRNGVEELLKGTVKLPYEDKEQIEATDASKTQLKEAWLKG